MLHRSTFYFLEVTKLLNCLSDHQEIIIFKQSRGRTSLEVFLGRTLAPTLTTVSIRFVDLNLKYLKNKIFHYNLSPSIDFHKLFIESESFLRSLSVQVNLKTFKI